MRTGQFDIYFFLLNIKQFWHFYKFSGVILFSDGGKGDFAGTDFHRTEKINAVIARNMPKRIIRINRHSEFWSDFPEDLIDLRFRTAAGKLTENDPGGFGKKFIFQQAVKFFPDLFRSDPGAFNKDYSPGHIRTVIFYGNAA